MMCSGIFQRFLFLFYNMSVIYCNSQEVKTSTFANKTTPFISINLDILQNPLEQRFFLLSYVFFKNQNIPNIFYFFFISMLWMINLFFAFKNKNCCYLCRFYHECTLELTDWLIWLIHQVWLANLNKYQLVEINSL